MSFRLSYLLVIAMFSLGAWSQVRIIDPQLLNEISSKNLTSVEVTGALRGSGIIVNFNDKPVVITNSHNLQGRKSARVRLFEAALYYTDFSVPNYKTVNRTFSIDAELPVLIDDPLHDFAFLSFEGKVSDSDLKLLDAFGKISGNFCYQQNCKNGWVANDYFTTLETHLGVVLNGKRTKLNLIPGVEPQLIDDQIISGEKRKILSLPVYSRPGVSGGGFYYRGILMGLITKVSLIGTPETYGSTFVEIGKIINTDPKDNVSAEWRNGELYVTVDGEEFVQKSSSNGGGETGHGGGETGHGGGETGHGGGETGHGGGETGHGGGGPDANFWTINFSKVIGSTTVTTWNPFVRRPSVFVLNNEEVAYFEVDGKLQLPGIATYRWNKSKGKKQKKFLYTPQNIEALEMSRHNGYSGAVCGRVYTLNNAGDVYLAQRGMQNTYADDAVLFVLPDSRGKYPRSFDSYRGGPQKIIDVPGTWKDQNGWHRSWYTAARRTPDMLLDFIRTELNMPIIAREAAGQSVTISSDLGVVKVSGVELKRLESKSMSSILYASDDKKIKAALLYDVSDLSQLERIYIQTAKELTEIGPCKNFVGVK